MPVVYLLPYHPPPPSITVKQPDTLISFQLQILYNSTSHHQATMNSFTGDNNTMGAGSTNPAVTRGATGMQGEHRDIGDKVFDAAAKKSGHNIAPNTAEKITDGARGLFEKVTGLVAPVIPHSSEHFADFCLGTQYEGQPQDLQLGGTVNTRWMHDEDRQDRDPRCARDRPHWRLT